MTTRAEGSSQTVLVALDGSPAAATALPVARVVAKQLGVELEILHILASGVPAPAAEALVPGDISPRERIGVRVEPGDPAMTILNWVEDPRVALVVLTTHGRVIEPGRYLGHTAEAVIAQTIQPVLLIRPEAAVGPHAAPSEIRQLLLPLDGSPTTTEALAPAIALASQLGASIDLLYVADRGHAASVESGSIAAPRYIDQPQHEWPAWADDVVAHLRACCGELPTGVTAHVFLAVGDIGDEIARFASEHHEDAIVLVRRSALEPTRAVILRAVLDRTPCPVLLVGRVAEGSDD
jgi:nucleotide-binding universal stress UspA family protein